jgi:AraC-like DNA-binding protein
MTDQTTEASRVLIYHEIADRLTHKYGPTNRAAIQIRQWATEEPDAERPQLLDAQGAAKESLRGQINYLLGASGIKQTWIAGRLGVSEKHLSQILTGQLELTLDWAQRIAALCGHTVSVTVTEQAQQATTQEKP